LDFAYSAFGLLIHSNLPLPGLPHADAGARSPDLAVHITTPPILCRDDVAGTEELTYVSSLTDPSGQPAFHIWNSRPSDLLRLAYSDGTQFWFDRPRQNLWVTWPGNLSLDSTLSYLLGPVLGLLLRLRGITCLHASAVALDDQSVLFVGAAGTGKSTTAATFAKLGHAVLSDDIVALSTAPPLPALNGSPDHVPARELPALCVRPAYPHISLWPDSVKMIYGSAASLPQLSPDWDKCRLSLGTDGTRFESRSLPVGAVYLLDGRGPDPAPYVRPARGQTALLSLVANTYANNLLDRDLRAQEFAVLDRLVASVPVRLLTPHQDPSRLDQLCALVLQDFRSLQQEQFCQRSRSKSQN
jgi:hypothetical protein